MDIKVLEIKGKKMNKTIFLQLDCPIADDVINFEGLQEGNFVENVELLGYVNHLGNKWFIFHNKETNKIVKICERYVKMTIKEAKSSVRRELEVLVKSEKTKIEELQGYLWNYEQTFEALELANQIFI